MFDLNDLRIFSRVASLRSFSAAARSLSQPRSNVSRSVARLEAALGTRLIHRTTREFELTALGEALMRKSEAALTALDKAASSISDFADEPRGELRISVGIGFGINVLAEQLPDFLLRYPEVSVNVDLTSRVTELIAERVDVAIRIGPLPDSTMVAVGLGELKRVICAAPSYLARKGNPEDPAELVDHDLVDIPAGDGRARTWSLVRDGRTSEYHVQPRVFVNDALSIHRLVLNGAGIGVISCYLCANEIRQGQLVHLFSDWSVPTLPVHLVFPSRRELAPSVRAFVNHMREANKPGSHWQSDLESRSATVSPDLIKPKVPEAR